MDESDRLLTVVGEQVQSGAYILRIRVKTPLALAFGRFRGGATVPLPAGDYLYVGSAMGRRGASSLARRLVRHATRSGDRAPHPIRAQMLETFARHGLGSGDLRPRRAKSLHWHVDYLLDPLAVSLTHVLAVRSTVRLEEAMAELVANRPYTSLPAPGLGASDTRGGTHLFAVAPMEAWWGTLVTRVARRLPRNRS